MSELLVVIPMKSTSLAKTRLRSVLSDQSREQLARSLFIRTLAILNGLKADMVFDIAVVTACKEIATIAQLHDALLIDEQVVCGLNKAAERAASFACNGGWRRLCIFPADLAKPQPDDLQRILSHDLGSRGVAICPSKDLGTNALLVTQPNAISFAYGPLSFHHHCRVASEAGISPVILPFPSLRIDLDSPADLAALGGIN